VSLIVTAFATLDDVRGTLTPQLQPGDTTLILVDLGQGRERMGGSMLAQVLGPVRRPGARPRRPGAAEGAGGRRQRPARARPLLAYHDRSDGGLWATVCEMAFAGQRA
jgi:phosphoribosylformylglycinamidine synthase